MWMQRSPISGCFPARPLVVLARLFTLHPEPNERSTTLLVRWVWRWFWSRDVDERTLKRRGIASIDGDLEASVQRLLDFVRDRPSRGNFVVPEAFDARTAESRLVQMALKLGGTKEFAAVTLERFRELARRVGEPPEDTEAIVTEAMERIVAAWAAVRDDPAVTDAYRAALRRHWQRAPLLQPYASRL